MPRPRRYGSKYTSKERVARPLRVYRGGAGAAMPSGATFAKRVKDIVLGLREDKSVCADTGPQSLTSGTWYTVKAFSIAQGDGSDNRDGDNVLGSWGKIRCAVVSPTDRVAFVRLMLVRWKGANGAFSAGALPADHIACVTPGMRAQYTVIRDVVIPLNPRTTGAAEESKVIFKELNFSDKNKKVYSSAGTTTAQEGQVYFCALHGSNFGGGTDDPEIDAQIEYHFKDM